jgi:GntR family transcriptional regulator / MocR family aminotransferase
MDLHVSLSARGDLSGEIYRQIRCAILERRIRAGDRLPSSRDLARTLRVARMTVVVAYERLAGEGFLVTRVGAGTFVSDQLIRSRSLVAPTATARSPSRCIEQRESVGPVGRGRDSTHSRSLRARSVWDTIPLPSVFARPARYDFRSGVPDLAMFPHRAWRRAMSRALGADVTSTGAYADPAGHHGLREAIARHIGVARGVRATVDDIVVTAGTQQALDLIARVLLEPSDRVAVEDPGYVMPRRLFATLGVRVSGVPVDGEGVVVESLPHDARLVYVTPSHQYPTGVSMSLARRVALLAWAERRDAVLIEDDYDTEFRFDGRPVESLQSLDRNGRVIYVGSFSKTLLPTLRVGFLVAPAPLRAALVKARFVSDWHGALPIQSAIARFIEDGEFARHLRRMRRVYAARREAIVDTLSRTFEAELRVVPSTAGLHVAAVACHASVERMAEVARRAADLDVAVQELAWFAHDVPSTPGLVLGYGSIAEDQIGEGLRRLRDCFV